MTTEHWAVICPERDAPGLWQKWLKEKCVAIGWPPSRYHLTGPTNKSSWRLARERALQIKPGDTVVPYILPYKFGTPGRVLSVEIADDQWKPTVKKGGYARNPDEPELGRRIQVEWLKSGPTPDKVAVVPLRMRTNGGEVKQTIEPITRSRYARFKNIFGNPKNWKTYDVNSSGPKIAPQTDEYFIENVVPNTAAYMQALEALMPLPPSYIDMLRFHYFQPARTATAAAIAEAAGFKKFRAASLHYGRLARLVGECLGWRPQQPSEEKMAVLVEFEKQAGHWNWIMRKELAEALESLGWVETTFRLLPGEMPDQTELTEGAVYHVAVTAYERNPEARRQCLAYYGPSCVVCGFDFKRTYGPKAEGFIHVHHLVMLSQVGKEYVIDPVKDLRPVCPNCHSVIHLKTPPYSIDDVKAMSMARRSKI